MDNGRILFCNVSQTTSHIKYENNIEISFHSNAPLNCCQQHCFGCAIYGKNRFKGKAGFVFTLFYFFSCPLITVIQLGQSIMIFRIKRMPMSDYGICLDQNC